MTSPDIPPQRPLAIAERLADDVLFARALDVDLGRRDVRDTLDELATAGLYGLHAPVTAGGFAADAATAGLVVEALAGGCLTTTFVWIQHQGAVKRLARVDGHLRDRYLADLASGRVRAGVAVGGIRPGRDPVVATQTDDGWSLLGTVPWITGWGLVDVLLVAARDGVDGDVLWFLVDAPAVAEPAQDMESAVASVAVHRVDLAVCNATNSAVVGLTDHPVPGDRLLTRQPYDEWQAGDEAGLRTNGSLPLGVAARCARLLEDDDLRTEVDAVRDALDRADVAALPAARAGATSLVWHAAQRLVITTGSTAVGVGSHAQRLAREAMLLQVFGTRPSITDAHLAMLSG